MIVASSVVLGKLLVQSFPVHLASACRFAIAAVILVPLLVFKEGLPSFSKKELAVLFLQAFFGVFLFNVCMLNGLKQTSAIQSGLITSTLPALTGLLSAVLLKERLTKRVLLAILFAVLGMSLIQLPKLMQDLSGVSFSGSLLIFCAVLCEAVFMICGKQSGQRISPLGISTMVSLFGVLLFLPFAVYEAKSFQFSAVTAGEWGIILYFGIVVTVLAFLLMYQGIRLVSGSTAGVLTAVLPVSCMMLAVVILGETFTLYQGFGLLFVIAAIGFIAKPNYAGSSPLDER